MNKFRPATVLLILCLFTVGSIPAVGKAFPGNIHLVTHLAVYALIAISFGLGWQSMQAMHLVAIVTTIGFTHEMTEIITHSHPFEFKDAIVNGFGALLGAAILYVLRKFRQTEKPQDFL